MIENTFPGAVLEGLASDLAIEVSREYRIEPDEARKSILEAWRADRKLMDAVSRENRPEKLVRTRAYRDAQRAAKRSLYYKLRRYQSSDFSSIDAETSLAKLPRGSELSAIVQHLGPAFRSHISTAERLAHYEEFSTQLGVAVGDAKSLIDVGCGLVPLLFPFDDSAVTHYCALDKNQQSVDTVLAYSRWRADGRIRAARWDIAQGWSGIHSQCGCDSFDVALLLKLIPVVQRQEPELLTVIAQIPAKRLVLTGSRQSMVKRRSIEKRELYTLEQFAQTFGFAIDRSFETEDEIGFVVVKR